MSRPMRIEFPGAVYHITARGKEPAVMNRYTGLIWSPAAQ